MNEPELVFSIVTSTQDPPRLSVRLFHQDSSAAPLMFALEDAGFVPGDRVRITRIGHQPIPISERPTDPAMEVPADLGPGEIVNDTRLDESKVEACPRCGRAPTESSNDLGVLLACPECCNPPDGREPMVASGRTRVAALQAWNFSVEADRAIAAGMPAPKALPCARCHSPAFVIDRGPEGEPIGVTCDVCEVVVHDKTYRLAVAKWNAHQRKAGEEAAQ